MPKHSAEIDATTQGDRIRIAQCQVRATAWESVWDCLMDSEYIGQVRTLKTGGQYYRLDLGDEWTWAGFERTESDPSHCWAIMALLDELDL